LQGFSAVGSPTAGSCKLPLPQLRTTELTQDFLDTLEKNILTFDDAIDAQIASIRNRDIAVEERVGEGNVLYAELVKLCNTGKDIFYSINEAKYNDYVIYNTPTGKVEVLPTSPEEEA
jgi:hypothetical protein